MKQFIKVTTLCFLLTMVLTACEDGGDSATTGDTKTYEKYDAELVLDDCAVEPGGNEEIKGKTYSCGSATMPENYDNPDGNKVKLSYIVLKATGETPADDPVVFLHGGPGSGAMIYVSQMVDDFATVRQNRDVIIFDQRGAGFSNASLDCSEELFSAKDQIATSVAEVSVEDAPLVKQEKIIKICTNIALKNGADLSQYNTINNARDVQNLVEALGYENFNLYGWSYGTELAQEILRQNPTGLRSVIFDSSVPLDMKFYERATEPAVESAQALFESCAADNECNTAYPNLESRFNNLMTALDETPIALSADSVISSKEVVALFLRRNDHMIGKGISTYLPQMIAELEQSKTDTYIGLMDGTLLPQVMEMTEALNDDGNVQESAEQDLSLATTFDQMILPLIETPEDDSKLKQEYLSLIMQLQTKETILNFVNSQMTNSDTSKFLKIANAMNDEDVSELFNIIHFSLAFQPLAIESNLVFPYRLFVCNESVPYNTMEGANKSFDSAPIQAMTMQARANVVNSIGRCGNLPTGQEPASYHNSVSSDVPVIVLNGLNDIQTAPSWGKKLQENFQNGQRIIFPESGHGVYQFSQCAKDIAADFFNYPKETIDSTCTNDLKIDFKTKIE